jgi:hypothetical protein
MKAFTAGLLMLALAGCAGPNAQPAPKRVLSPGEHLEECMNKFNACQMDAWCAQQPVCQREQQRDPTQRSTLPQVDPRLPRVP